MAPTEQARRGRSRTKFPTSKTCVAGSAALERGLLVYTFFDLAAAETGRIPPEILEDEAIVEKLLILFRTLRGQKVSDEQLDELVRKLRKV
jgi:hypothetical protein